MEFEPGRHGLATHLLSRLQDAWRTNGTGVYEANAGYVTWTKYRDYLQIECDGPAPRTASSGQPDDQLQRNGFQPPDADHPLHWAAFTDPEDLCFAAIAAADVIHLSLEGDPQAARWLPESHAGVPPVRPGTVVVVAPLQKAQVTAGVVRAMAAGLGAAGPVVILDQLGRGRLGTAWPNPTDAREHLARDARSRDSYVHLNTPSAHSNNFTGHLATALDTARIISELRSQGTSVVVSGYWILSDNAWQYRELGRRIADRLVVVANEADVQFGHGRDVLNQLISPPPNERYAPSADARLVTYADARWPSLDPVPTALGWPQFNLGEEADLPHAESWACEEALARFLADGLPSAASPS